VTTTENAWRSEDISALVFAVGRREPYAPIATEKAQWFADAA
jgi:hypothetical protein